MERRRPGIEKNNSPSSRGASFHATKYVELVSRGTAEAALIGRIYDFD